MKSPKEYASKRALRVALVLGAFAVSFAGLRWGEQRGAGLAGSARAFNNLSTFSADAQIGGGGSRFFTGSPRDGFTCGVCHQSERFFEIELKGLPEKIKPGQTYDLRFAWEGGFKGVYFNAEIVNAKGASAGELVVQDEGSDEVTSKDTEDDREILSVRSSKKRSQSEVAFKWKAAAKLSGPLTVHIAGVRKQDDDKNPKGAEKNPLEDDELTLYTAQIAVAGRSSASEPDKKKDSKD